MLDLRAAERTAAANVPGVLKMLGVLPGLDDNF